MLRHTGIYTPDTRPSLFFLPCWSWPSRAARVSSLVRGIVKLWHLIPAKRQGGLGKDTLPVTRRERDRD
jgi:hypothetical protein